MPISVTISPIRDKSGSIVGASKIARDITLKRQIEEQQDMLLSEMRHRVGNCFAVANGLLRICARQADSTEDLVRMMQDRFQAPSHAHSLAVPAPNSENAKLSQTGLADLVFSIVEPFIGAKRPRIEVADCPVAEAAITGMRAVLDLSCEAVSGLRSSEMLAGDDVINRIAGA